MTADPSISAEQLLERASGGDSQALAQLLDLYRNYLAVLARRKPVFGNWRDVGFMGSTYYETPHIDRLAEGGIVFTNAYANAPICSPTRYAFMTGRYQQRGGMENAIETV